MPTIPCAWCGEIRAYNFKGVVVNRGHGDNRRDILRGVLTCAHCDRRTVFEMTGDVVSSLPGKLFLENMETLSDNVVGDIEEAVLCYYGGAYRGTAGLCRSAIEDALDEKNCKGDNLEKKIEAAKNGGILKDEQVSHAHSARLVGRDALHRQRQITTTEAMLAISSASRLANEISLKGPLPASQSRKGSNEQ